MWLFVLVSVLKLTIPNLRHDVASKGVGNLKTYLSKQVYNRRDLFCMFLPRHSRVMLRKPIFRHNLKTMVWLSRLIKVKEGSTEYRS
jgi:hypothetical protein